MIRTIVVDDEKYSLEKLVKLLDNSGLAEVMGKFTRPLEAMEFLKENKVDAVFLDIEMPNMDGIELSSYIIDLQEDTSIIFATAYNQYAVEAFRLNAIDYLMKPVSANRLETALRKVIEMKGINLQTCGIKISCFGRFTVSNGIDEVKFRTEKAEELLAFMIDRRGRFISRSEIIDSLWPDFDGERALIHFNTTLHYVKKALLQYGINISFTYDRGGYKFELDGLDCDYLKFRSFVDKNKAPSSGNILEYEEAASLFKGEYLSGWDYEWASLKRLTLEEQFISLILEMVNYYTGAGNCQKAERWLKTGLSIEPLHRGLNCSLIELLLKTNENALAKRYYEVYKNDLKKKLGCEPDEEFRKMFL